MAKSSIKDMTQGNPTKLIIGFAFPMLLEIGRAHV